MNFFNELSEKILPRFFFSPVLNDEENQQLATIQVHAKNQAYDKLIESLKAFCGTKENVKIVNGNQIQLFFGDENRRKIVSEKLIERFKAFHSILIPFLRTFHPSQFSSKTNLFCLTLSTEQTSVLLGINPKNGLNEVQAIAQEIERVQKDFFSDLPPELVYKILSYLNFELNVVRCCIQLSKKMHQVTDNENLWTQIAGRYLLSIAQLSTNREYIKKRLVLRDSLCDLKSYLKETWTDEFSETPFACRTQEQILQNGGICLTKNLNPEETGGFYGAIFLEKKENAYPSLLLFTLECRLGDEEKEKAVKQEYNDLMPIVITKLLELNKTPDYFMYDGMFASDMEKYFLEWQNENKRKMNT